MKIKVAFGSWEEAEEFTVTAVAITDGNHLMNDQYEDIKLDHQREYGEVREAWLHIPDDVVARLFNVPTISPKVEAI